MEIEKLLNRINGDFIQWFALKEWVNMLFHCVLIGLKRGGLVLWRLV